MPETRETWLLNKPTGVVSTAKEPGRRRAVTELIDTEARLYPVGRLDADSSGLILLSNDGELANRLTHPRYEVPKTYRVELRRPPASAISSTLRRGVELDDGRRRRRGSVATGERLIEMTIHEGRNRQVRRMAEAIGNEASRWRGSGSARCGSASLPRARRAGSTPEELTAPLGRFRACERRTSYLRCVARSRSEANDVRIDPCRERRSWSREVISRNELEPQRHRQLPVHLHRRPQRRVPGRSRARARPRRCAAALRAGDRRPGLDAAGDPA